jgi:hypothetical protein
MGLVKNHPDSKNEAALYGWPLQRVNTPVYSSLVFGVGAQTITHNELKGCGFIIPKALTLDRLGIQVTTAQVGGECRVGIYENTPDTNYPGALVVDAGTLACTSTGHKSATISETLEPGLYWGACITNIASIAMYRMVNGFSTIHYSSFGGYNNGWGVAQAYGALPDPFTAGGAADNDVPAIQYRISAYL